MTSNNMYRVGDFVYFEVSAAAPYQIRKIEELNKTSTGAVEAKVVCFYRRRDLSLNLIQLADKHQKELSHPSDGTKPELLHQLRHREIFLSRHLETLPATHIRGKCTVTLHSDTEPCDVYLTKEDAFFFQLVYDPLQKTLQADRGQIREGPEYQAEVPSYIDPNSSSSNETREELRWRPDSGLSDADIDSFLLLSRSLGTLGRAYHAPSILRQPSLTMSAAAAARDATHQLALDVLHAADYDVTRALQHLAPKSQPLVKLDEMEQWSASEGNLFEEALCKYGKCFYDIQNDFLPWKHPKSLIEFYYMWKTTDHYIQQKRIKAAEAEHHLKQVYIPNYNKPNPSVLYPNPDSPNAPPGCEGCNAPNSAQWYALGPATSPLKVCAECWAYWKRYGDLKAASILDKVTDSSTTNFSTNNPSTIADKSTSKLDLARGVPPKTFAPNSHNLARELAQTASTSSSMIPDDQLGYRPTHKPRTGINFHFIAPIPLRLARRLRPICHPPRRQARRPFKRMASCAALHTETAPLLAKLSAARTQQLLHLVAFRHTEASCSNSRLRTDSLHLLLTRRFPNRFVMPTCTTRSTNGSVKPEETKPHVDGDLNASKSDGTIQSNTVNGVSTANSNTQVTLKRPASFEGTETLVCSEQRPVKRAFVADKLTTVVRPEKAPTTLPEPDATTTGIPILVGPRRRIGMGVEENGAVTLMYRATDLIKRSRRKLLSVTELRRFGRHPWSHYSSKQQKTVNGTDVRSNTDYMNGPKGSNSNRDVSASTRTNSNALIESPRVHEEINGPLSLNASASTTRQPVAP